MDRNFGGVIWTNHAMERMRQRGIKQGDAWATWRRPDQSYRGNLHKNEEGFRYYKRYGNEIIEVVATQNEKKEWIILSVWSRPVSQNQVNSQGSTGVEQKLSFGRRLYNWIFKV